MAERERAILTTSTQVLSMALSVATQRGVLVTLAPLLAVLALGRWRDGAPDFLPPWTAWVGMALGVLAAALVGGGASIVEQRRGRRWLMGGLALAGLSMAPTLWDAPHLALALFLKLAGAAVWVSRPDEADASTIGEARRLEERRVVGASSLAALLGWAAAGPGGIAQTPLELGVSAGVLVMWAVLVLPWLRAEWARGRTWRRQVLLGAGAVAALGATLGVLQSSWQVAALGAMALPLSALIIGRGGALMIDADERPWWVSLVEHPARFLVGSFLGLCLLGGVALSFPVCSTRPDGAPLIDAMFTSFSSTCVTGLAVLDTPGDFNGLGQLLILILFQVGGLGIMTFSTAAMLLLGQRMSLRHEAAVVELIGSSGRSSLQGALRRMLTVTFVTEGLGALALTVLFLLNGDSFGAALWRGVFTSISAFCNAGFALHSDSLVGYQRDPAVLLVISIIIIVGAMGPGAVIAFPRWIQRRKVTAQASMALGVTSALLILPAIFIGAAEWENTLAGLGGLDRVMNAWFQSVTLRTAGFNSIDLAAVHPATLTLMYVLMFIGGSPGSTAGGVKTTTVMVLLLAVVAALRGRSVVTFGGWRIPHSTVYKAAAIATMGGLSVIVALMLLQLTQPIPLPSILFEAISALATVGLTIGATAELDGVGKIIIMCCMFMGRVGPLTLFLLLMTPDDHSSWRLPEQEIAVG